ncbi:ParB/RepB/Spo0J family partition protein [Caballeronia sp. LZ019]|uniref:ParB/RepB/Spo0J family partition protein n=1 Tax=Caballeronia sp. LZ019 TaxID=3038555 RepID=UPI0028629A03|nr:ParB/RepB/Spo0J family partition protein [Caballeronia sp. LZ019]MDR5809096.1 ParB/RepB/Spo0J family partition protein [Caballeronia sp. LZ019]
MSMKNFASKAANIRLTNEEADEAQKRAATTPRTAPGQLMHLQAKSEQQQDEIDRLKKELQEAKQMGGAVDVPLSDLHEVPGRRRYMAPEKYAELRDNLRHNKLIHPVVVLPRTQGGFEIISGHHRSDAYRELGRETIRCVLGEATPEEADEGAFFANLMQSDLTDYEKYVGIKRFQHEHPELTKASVAEHVGISPSHISALLSFERLPQEARKILEANMALLGANAAAELAVLAEAGKSDRVLEAVKRLADGKFDQSQAIKFVRASVEPKKAATGATNFKIRSGKTTWCDVRSAKNVMRIEFQSEEIANSVRDAIRKHLEQLAQVQKNANH